MFMYMLSDVYGFWLELDLRDGYCLFDQYVIDVVIRLYEVSSVFNGKLIQSFIEDMLLGVLFWMKVDWVGFFKFDFF